MCKRYAFWFLPALILLVVGAAPFRIHAQDDPLNEVLQNEAKRVAAVAKVRPSVVAIFAKGGKGGGSGVLISKDGYALTNFHVVRSAGKFMQCGLADGVLYDAVLVGWDKVGDVALIKLLPKKPGDEFPYSVMGDSDQVREGDWSLAMGNPFLLATDFTPTVTFGMVSGVHRYQYPSGAILEYTDCIQTDTSINPGNSGGPLFNLDGELIGINGRGSFDKRGRVNSGVGYAISINQIKNFMGHLKAGLDADHASLGALVASSPTEDGSVGRVVVTQVLFDSDVARRGLEFDDELVSFDGRPISSVNQFKNVIGIYPRGWRLPMVYSRRGERHKVLVRLMGAIPKQLGGDPDKEKAPKAKPSKKSPKSPAAKYFESKDGFINYYFNKLEKNRVLTNFKKQSDFGKFAGDWSFFGSVRFKQLKNETPIKIQVRKEKKGDGSLTSVVRMTVNAFPYRVEPLNAKLKTEELQQPGTSGGLLVAMYLYHRFLTLGTDGFPSKCDYAGTFPIYPPLPNGRNPTDWHATKTLAEALDTTHGPYKARWYFSPADQKLVAFEVWVTEEDDPCEVYLSEHKQVQGQLLPHQMQVRYGNGTYGTITVNNVQFSPAAQ